jgi:asparagine synthase (glutamine-hydrolysing)
MSSVYTRAAHKLSGLRIGRLAKSVRHDHLTYLSAAKLARIEGALRDIDRRGTEGAFLEFGVALGGSAIVIASAAARTGRRFVGFDVFGMIPPPTSDKDDAGSKERYQVIASGGAAGIQGDTYYGYRDDLYGEVVDAFARYGLSVDGQSVALVKGLFEETWPSVQIPSVAFCHIDCDWYDPVRFCLEQVSQKLSPQGVIILDDYHDWGGCRVATDEFVANHPQFRLNDGPNATLRRHVQ